MSRVPIRTVIINEALEYLQLEDDTVKYLPEKALEDQTSTTVARVVGGKVGLFLKTSMWEDFSECNITCYTLYINSEVIRCCKSHVLFNSLPKLPNLET